MGVANVVSKMYWLRNLLLELRCPISTVILIYYHNVSANYLSENPVQHQRSKYFEMDIHFVREKVERGQVRVLHVPSWYQIAYIFTIILFEEFKESQYSTTSSLLRWSNKIYVNIRLLLYILDVSLTHICCLD